MTAKPVRDPRVPIEIVRAGQAFSVYPKDPPGNPDFWDPAMTWETPTYAALAGRLHRAATFWDIGAWCGPFTLYAAAAGATTWAFEPDPIAYAHLIENLTIDQGPGEGLTFPMMFACGAHTGAAVLYADALGDSRTSQRAKGTQKKALEVPVVRLDDLAPHIGAYGAGPDVVKIDCEGMEAEVLAGMMETIVNDRPTIVISLHPGYLYGKDWAVIERVAAIYGESEVVRDQSELLVWSR